jgi:hypothetical protein
MKRRLADYGPAITPRATMVTAAIPAAIPDEYTCQV